MQRHADVVVLAAKLLQPLFLRKPSQLWLGFLGQGQKISGVALFGARRGAELGTELANRVEHAVARPILVGARHEAFVEERREIVENQVKQELFNWRDDVRPRIVGKMDEHDKRFLTFAAELSVASLASSLTERLLRLNLNPEIADMLRAKADWFNGREATQMQAVAPITRTPYFCSGCPHNTSTRVPEGSRALAGIGCHYLSQFMDRSTATFTQMGGEGVPWIGQAPFTETQHIFANLGDGTYTHSGVLAVRAAVAAKVGPGKTVAVVGEGAVGLCGVIAARRLGAEHVRIASEDVPADVARRNAEHVAHAEKHVRVVLADADAEFQCLFGSRIHARDAGLVAQFAGDPPTQRTQHFSQRAARRLQHAAGIEASLQRAARDRLERAAAR